ncbi:MAG: DUF2096 domain-containing protein [Candidatus Bathyarchaeota archaeon]|nr:DUF2096 domain-containing protein [Candidatus Bathyarchaeota archaeon]MDH5732518.1 DUF2096 domain-containing protein [Candidatus Bathyarchaeota archaeon]
MGYEEAWKVLAELIKELRKRGETIPANVMKDLRSAKTMIQVFKADTAHIENIPQIEKYLGSAESYLFLMVEEKYGRELFEEWMEKLSLARRKVEERKETVSKFVPGLPRGKHWLRIQISKQTPRKEIERLVKEEKLSCKIQKNGYMLVYGNIESIKSFVKMLAEKSRETKKR